MNEQEQRDARTILEHYVVENPTGDPRQAIRDERWLEGQGIGWLQEFENGVTCLQVVLRRVMERRYAAAGLIKTGAST